MRTQKRHAPLPLNEFKARFPLVEPRAHAAAKLVLGHTREHLVQEIVNHVLLLLWQRQRSNKLPEKPESWAYTVAWRRAVRLAHVEGRYVGGLVERVEDAEEGAAFILMPADETTPVNHAEMMERLGSLKTLLDAFDVVAHSNLTEQETELYELLYKQRLAGSEVAARLGVSPEVVRQQWSRLLTRLLVLVREELQSDPNCAELLAHLLKNQTNFRRKVLQLLRFVMKEGVEALEKMVRATLNN